MVGGLVGFCFLSMDGSSVLASGAAGRRGCFLLYICSFAKEGRDETGGGGDIKGLQH